MERRDARSGSRGRVHGVRHTERGPRMSPRPGIRYTKASRAQRAMDDPFIARTVERDHRMGVASARCKIVFRPAEVADSFFTRRRHEFDWMLSGDADAVDLARQRQHDREPSAIVVDPGADETLGVAADGEIRLAWKDRIEVRADHDRCRVNRPVTTANDVPDGVCLDARQSAIAEPAGDPFATLLFLSGRRGDLRDGDLRPQNRVIVCRKTRVRGREKTVGCTRVGKRRRTRSHAFNCDSWTLPRKW